MNFETYPWLSDLSSPEATAAMEEARASYRQTGAVTFPGFLGSSALEACRKDALRQESTAFTTDDIHTAYLRPTNSEKDQRSVENLEMRTQVASIAFDELPENSILGAVYKNPTLRNLVARIVGKKDVYLSDDPLGCCSINVFRPGYHHSFHFDESEFSTTLMIQEAETPETGLFQYTKPLRDAPGDLALAAVARTITTYDQNVITDLLESSSEDERKDPEVPALHTLDFVPGTLSIFAGSKSLHRVTKVEGSCSRLVAVFTFASQPGFQNTPAVQKMFWGRAAQS